MTEEAQMNIANKKLEGYIPADYVEMLTDRVFKGVMKYLATVLGVLAVVVGIFGWDYKNSLDKIREDFKKEQTEIKEQKKEIEGHKKEISQYLETLKTSTQEAKLQISEAQNKLQGMANVPREVGIELGKIEGSLSRVQEKITNAQAAAEKADNASRKMSETEIRLTKEQETKLSQMDRTITTRFHTLNGMVKTQLDEDTKKRDQKYSGLESRVDEKLGETEKTLGTLQQEVFETAAWKIREKDMTPVWIKPKEASQSFLFHIKVGVVAEKRQKGKPLRIEDFEIYDDGKNIITCSLGRPLVQSDEVSFSYHGYRITLVIRDNIDLNWAKDYVGIQIRWIQENGPKACKLS